MTLIEIVAEGGGQLPIVLVGNPKLKNDRHRPLRIGVACDGKIGHHRPQIAWPPPLFGPEGSNANPGK